MIYVDRTREPAPGILLDATLKTGGPQETTRAIEFFKKARNRGKSFPYSVYSDTAVKAALERLFRGKCAYCESTYMHLQPTEVEHWRPKGEVETEKKQKIRPGYYWLAAAWENLLPSCIDCNRQRYHKLGDGKGKPVLLGKKNSFPIEPGSKRAGRPKEEQNEKPLLLHPCHDQPPEYLEFAEEELRRGIVCARTKATKEQAARAEASIDVYALNRAELVWERKKRYIDILKQMRHVEEAGARVKNAPNAAARKLETDIYEREMKDLLAFQEEDQPYSLMARQIIADFTRSHL